MTARILCPWDTPGSSYREPADNAAHGRGDLRRCAAMLIGEARGDPARAAEMLRELTAESEAL